MSFGSSALERSKMLAHVVLAAIVFTLPLAAFSQTTTETIYMSAAAQPSGHARIAALEEFLSRAPADHRSDALEILICEYSRAKNEKQAASAARELLSIDASNPFALAALANGGSERAHTKEQRSALAQHQIQALRNLEHLPKPAGITDAEFMAMNRAAYATLSAAIGSAYFKDKDYEQARAYLRNAVAVQAENSQYVYQLGLADLAGHSPNAKEGYWMMARAVVLTQGTSGGQQIADYAQKSYEEAGGTAASWSQFLAAARAPRPMGTTSAQTQLTSARTPAESGGETARIREPATTSEKAKEDKEEQKRVEASIWKPAAPEADTIAPEPTRVPFPPGEPVSLGILIEASDATKQNRAVIVQGLSDIVRRLRPKDEAFILAFSNHLMFEQDLTQNYHLLEQAVDNIKPQSGTALYDAVGFAAGHLKRIARNRNQAILVISDGRNSNGKENSSLRLASEIGNVRIYCIGMDVDAPANRETLQILAGRSGGEAAFVSKPNEFEPAAQQLAQIIYGEKNRQ